MGMKIQFESNADQTLDKLSSVISKVLEMWGSQIEGYAAELCPVGTAESTGKKGYRGGTLRGSITHEVNEGEKEVIVGSNVPYSAYVELGTGPFFEPPPDWEVFDTEKGSGIGHSYVKPRPYLRPAVEGHVDEYRQILQDELEQG